MASKIAALLGSVAFVVGTFATCAPASAATPSCGNSAIAVSASQTEGATGHGSLVLRFRNASARTCTLRGYPPLSAIAADGRFLARAASSLNGFAGGSHHGIQLVVLRPGSSASATVEWMNFNAATSGSCPFSASIATAAPNTTRLVSVARSVSTCELHVHPVVPGLSGNS